MRKPPHKAEKYRLRHGDYGSDALYGNNGAFFIPGPCGRELKVIASDGPDWEHVSVSLDKRCPNWREMCCIKDMFWDDDEVVIQYHPAKSEYVNQHPNCLHMWRPIDVKIPTPPNILVGVKDMAKPSKDEAEAMRKWGLNPGSHIS